MDERSDGTFSGWTVLSHEIMFAHRRSSGTQIYIYYIYIIVSTLLCSAHQVSPGRPGASRIGTSEKKLQVVDHLMNLMNSPAQRLKDHTRWMLGGDFHTWLVSVSKEHRWKVLEIFSATPHPQLCSLGAVDFLNQVWDALIFIYRGRTWKFPSIVDKAWWFAGNEKTVSILWQWMQWCKNTLFSSFFMFLLLCSLQACHPWKVISVMLCGHSRRCTHCWYRCHALRVVHHRCLPCWRCLCKQRAGHQNASEMSHTRHH